MILEQHSHPQHEARLRVFEKRLGFMPNLDAPTRFSEKLVRRILMEDDPFYTLYGTKIYANHFVKGIAPPSLHFAKRYKVARRLTPEVFYDLPNRFVVKSSFGSGLNRIVLDKAKTDLDEICAFFNKNMPTKVNAKGVVDPNNCAIIEEYLESDDGIVPNDLRFHCFQHPVHGFQFFLQLRAGEVAGEREQTFFDSTLTQIFLTFHPDSQPTTPAPIPDGMSDAVEIIKSISAYFDYIRIDLYSVRGKIDFGEITPFHRGGMSGIVQPEWDLRWGELWHQRLPSFQPPG